MTTRAGNRFLRGVPLLFLLLVLAGSMAPAPACAGPRAHGPSLRQLPPGHRVLRPGLFFYDGFYYRQGAKGFFTVAPPVGLVVASLPDGFVRLTIAGLPYFCYQGVYYRPVENGYRVVEPPPQPVAKGSGDAAQAEVGDKVAVFADWLNLRSAPGKQHPVLQVLRKGTELRVKERSGNWYFIELDNGKAGWVMSRYTRKLLNPVSG